MRKDFMLLISVTLAVTTLGVGRTAAQVSEKPQPPAWVNKDGTVDFAKAPREVPVVAADGKTVMEANGNEKKVPTYFGQVPPPPLRGGESYKR
jgi:hypothetical protein